MKHLIICLIVIINLSWLELSGSGLLLPWSANAAASGSSGFISSESSSVFCYPAWAESGVSLSSTYLYNIPELPYSVLAIVAKRGQLNFGYGIKHLHHPNYRESEQLLNFGYAFKQLRLGLNLCNLLIDISDEKMKTAFLFDMGIAWQQNNISTAFSWLNTTSATIDKEKLPVYVIWEINWQLVTAGSLGLRIEKEDDFEFHPAVAGDYRICKALRLISSYSLYPASLGSGFEITIGKVSVSYALQYHEDLLESHYLSLQYAVFD
jgi:hypothetical protein